MSRIPIPSVLTHQALREARRPLPPSGVLKAHAVEGEMLGRTRSVWLDRHRASEGIIVHLHGGAYVSGPYASDWAWLSRQVDAYGCAGLLVDYRTAPDHVHPIAIDDTEAVIAALVEQGLLDGTPWILSGQHSGGGAAFSVARRLQGREGAPVPAGVIATSPWLDLELANAGITETGQSDPVHERRLLRDAAKIYAGRTPLDDPELSPLNATFDGLPPVHLSVGLKDLFLSDVRVAKLQLEEHGVDLSYREVSGRLGLQLMVRRGEDMDRLHREQADFIAARLRG
ncbi:alpha/beta hydrolase fold domain-containing protein [Brachybacterium sp. DNPG3]